MNRNTGLIATIATAILCGCPGLFSCFMGFIFSAVSFMPGADIDVFGSSDPISALLFGLGQVCIGIIFITIPIAVWYFTVRGRGSRSHGGGNGDFFGGGDGDDDGDSDGGDDGGGNGGGD